MGYLQPCDGQHPHCSVLCTFIWWISTKLAFVTKDITSIHIFNKSRFSRSHSALFPLSSNWWRGWTTNVYFALLIGVWVSSPSERWLCARLCCGDKKTERTWKVLSFHRTKQVSQARDKEEKADYAYQRFNSEIQWKSSVRTEVSLSFFCSYACKWHSTIFR